MSENMSEFYEQKNGIHQKTMLKELARLHATSTQKIPIKKEEITRIYDSVLKDWNQKIQFLEHYIEQCERKWYMSPFELLYCTIYYEQINATRFAKEKFDEWYEIAKEQNDVRLVVNHGNVRDQHFVYDKNGYGLFISFEKAKWAFPIFDLVGYFHRKLKTYPTTSKEYQEWYFAYQKIFPFNEDEQLLFLSYLVFPEQMYRVIKSYTEMKDKTELQYVNQLQNRYWQLKNIEFFVTEMINEQEINIQKQEEGADSIDTL